MHWEEQRKAMQADMHNKAELARFEDELARKRADTEHDKQRARQVELVRYVLAVAGQLISHCPTQHQLLHAYAKCCKGAGASVSPFVHPQIARGEFFQPGSKKARGSSADRSREACHRAV